MTWTKICGITSVADGTAVAAAGGSAIGLNFYAPSPRFITVAAARTLVQRLRETAANLQIVGVFVNHTADEVASIARECQLDWVQLHGDESVDDLAAVKGLCPAQKLIRAWRMRDETLADLAASLDECRQRNCLPDACLIDAHTAGSYGGSGHTVAWDRLWEAYKSPDWPPLILAGGLKPENIADAVKMVQPWGVDTASGVEVSPGIKDADRVHAFIAAAG